MTPAQQTLVLEQIAGRMATLNDLLMLAQATPKNCLSFSEK